MTRERWLPARRAAEHVGYEPGPGPSRRDPAMRAFYAFVQRHRHRIRTKKFGALLRFKESDLDRVMDEFADADDRTRRQSRIDEAARRAREDARIAARSA